MENFDNEPEFDADMMETLDRIEVDVAVTNDLAVADLQAQIETGAWRNNLLLRQLIYRKYMELGDKGVDLSGFGTAEFWDANEQSGSGGPGKS